MPKFQRLIAFLFLATCVGLAKAAVPSECCYTTNSDSDNQYMNVTVYWYAAADHNYQYRVELTFPAVYTMQAAQPWQAPLGTVSCSKTSHNVYACSSRDSNIFYAVFDITAPDNHVGLTAAVSLRNDVGVYLPCTGATTCAAVPAIVDHSGTYDFGPFGGRRPKWFAIVLAGAGGVALALCAFIFVAIRSQVSHSGPENQVAARHDEKHGQIETQKAIQRAESLRRVPTIRQVQRDRTFGQTGTLLGGLPVVADIRDGRTYQAKTLIEGMIQTAHHDAEGVVPGPSGLHRSDTLRSAKSTRGFGGDYSPQRRDVESGGDLQRTESPRSFRKPLRNGGGGGGTYSPSVQDISPSRADLSRDGTVGGGGYPRGKATFMQIDPYGRYSGDQGPKVDEDGFSAVTRAKSAGSSRRQGGPQQNAGNNSGYQGDDSQHLGSAEKLRGSDENLADLKYQHQQSQRRHYDVQPSAGLPVSNYYDPISTDASKQRPKSARDRSGNAAAYYETAGNAGNVDPYSSTSATRRRPSMRHQPHQSSDNIANLQKTMDAQSAGRRKKSVNTRRVQDEEFNAHGENMRDRSYSSSAAQQLGKQEKMRDRAHSGGGTHQQQNEASERRQRSRATSKVAPM
ncbi:hypothetical protein DFJ77DRAFT_359910 [Powellomyces hirtus]|nr:hypothetical protein DFJ77DRAFT_359910 [Powellomyces hirtus]